MGFTYRPSQNTDVYLVTTTHIIMLSYIILFTLATSVMGKTHYVYWNSTNPIFKMDNNDHVLDVNSGNSASEYDQMHLICPNSGEQHVVYSVTEDEYNSCRVTSQRPRIVAVCDRPGVFRYFTITFRSFSPTPGGLEFKPGQTYYFISTSTRRDLHRRAGGYCSTHNMKMALKIGEQAPQHNYDNSALNSVRINVPRIVTTTTTTTTTTERPRQMWRSRVPDYRSDYIYYYKPWAQQGLNKFIKIEPLNKNTVSALPLTSGSQSFTISTLSTLLVIVFTLLNH